MLSYVLPNNPGVAGPADQATRMAINDLGMDTYHDVLTPGPVPCLTHGLDLPRCLVPGWPGLVRRAAGPFGGCGDVAEHPAEYRAVERRDGPPVRVSGEPARLGDSPLTVGGHGVR